ncbi:MAG: hypothetical protein MUO26_08900 [Methanotrichaceae archaeon]|nr:hypothetical protein [Methanotrichaceae archaeon]
MRVQIQVYPKTPTDLVSSFPDFDGSDNFAANAQSRKADQMISIRIIILIILFSCLAGVGSAGNFLSVQDITMYLNEGNATFHLNYTLDTFTNIYVLVLGSGYIQPDLVSMFANFKDVKIKSVDHRSATILAVKAGKYNGSHYFFTSRPLEIADKIPQTKIGKFRVIYPNEFNQIFYNISCTPDVLCKATNQLL